MRSPLLGRDEVVARIADALADTEAGRGGLLWFAGEAGIGKTRVLAELEDRAAASGWVVLRGSGWEDPVAPAFWVWTQVLRAAAALRPPDAWDARGREARALLEGTSTQPDVPGRFPLFDSVSSVVTATAAGGPVLVVLDDLHWADQGSLRLLRFLLGAIVTRPVLVACGWRTGEARLPVDAAEIAGRGHMVELGGLTEAAVAELVEAVTGTRPVPADAASVRDRTGGNPLFVREMARLATVRGSTSVADAVPATVAATVQRRVARVSQACHDLLAALAVAGPGATRDLVAALVGRRPRELATTIDEAVDVGLLHVDGDRPVFTHALLRDAVLETVPAGRRRELHLAAADHLADTSTRAAEATHHLVEAFPLVDLDRVLATGDRAAREAVGMLAFEDAARIRRQLLDLLPPDHPDRVRMLLALGECLLATGDLETARPAYAEAAELARRGDDAEGIARAALGFASGLGGFEVRLGDRMQLDLLEEALGRLPVTDSELRAYVLARLSVALAYTDTPGRRRKLAEEATEMARRLGASRCIAHALAAHCDTMAGPADSARRIGEATEIIDLARGVRDHATELLGLRLRVVAELETGAIGAAEADMRAFGRRALDVRQPLYAWYVPLWDGCRAHLRGDLDELRRSADEAERIGSLAGSRNAVALAVTQRMWVELEAGALDRVLEHLVRMFDEVPEMAPDESGGMFAMMPGQPEHLRRDYLPRLEATLDTLPTDDSEWLSYLGHCATSMFEGDDDGRWAGPVYRHLLPYAERYVVDGIGAVCMGSAERFLGMLASLAGERDTAAAHFARALVADERIGSRVHPAATHRAHGLMLLRAGDRAAATEQLDRARALYDAAGIVPRVEEIDGLLGEPVDTSSSDAVFRREGAVWRVVFRGRSTTVRHGKGMADLAVLLRHPGHEVHVLDLTGVPRELAQGTAGPPLDDRAKAAYRARLAELEDAAAAGDDRADEERDALLAELSAAYGLGGRERRTGAAAERARSAVTRRIRDAVRVLAREDPVLGRHLEASVRTGTFCSYQPESEQVWLTT